MGEDLNLALLEFLGYIIYHPFRTAYPEIGDESAPNPRIIYIIFKVFSLRLF